MIYCPLISFHVIVSHIHSNKQLKLNEQNNASVLLCLFPSSQTTSMPVSVIVLVLLPPVTTPVVDSLAIPLPFIAADALATPLPLPAAAAAVPLLDAPIMATSASSPSPHVTISTLFCAIWPCGNDLAARVTLRGKDV